MFSVGRNWIWEYCFDYFNLQTITNASRKRSTKQVWKQILPQLAASYRQHQNNLPSWSVYVVIFFFVRTHLNRWIPFKIVKARDICLLGVQVCYIPLCISHLLFLPFKSILYWITLFDLSKHRPAKRGFDVKYGQLENHRCGFVLPPILWMRGDGSDTRVKIIFWKVMNGTKFHIAKKRSRYVNSLYRKQQWY